MKKTALIALACVAFTGCAYQVQMMPRDSGKVFSGEASSSGGGTGSIFITIDGDRYDGTYMQVASDAQFGFVQAYGSNNRGTRATATATSVSGGSNSAYKAILTSQSGKGLRCDFQSSGMGAAGVCVDDARKPYDVIVTPKR